MILTRGASNLAGTIITGFVAATRPEHVMKFFITVATWLAGATLATAIPTAQASPGNQRLPCTAKVIYSEELPFAPINSWLVKVIVEITPPNGNTYQTTLQDWMPWQGPPPRRGQAFRVNASETLINRYLLRVCGLKPPAEHRRGEATF